MMTVTPHADALLTALISGEPQIEAFATLTEEHERDKALHVLIAMLTDPDPRLRERANRALGVMGDRRAVDTMLSTFRQQGNWPHVSDAKFDALVRLRDPEAILPLLARYGIRIRDRNRLMDAFDRFDQQDVARILGDATEHDEETIREAALSLLNMRDDPRICQLLIKALDDESVTIRCGAAKILMNRRTVEAVPSLLPHTSDPHLKMRQWTALALGELGDQWVIPLLLPLLSDEDPEVRTYTAIALGKLGDPSGLDLICAHIALKTLRAPVVPLLIELFDKLSWQAMVLSAEIFAEQGDPAALPVLQRMLNQDEEWLRTAAQRAIDAIKARMGEDES